MADHFDSIIQAGAALITGILGSMGVMLSRARRRGAQEQRCELVCTSLTTAFEMFLDAMEAAGISVPGMANAIRTARLKIDEARTHLNQNEG